VLLLSADPAHSLGDVLGMPLGDDARPVPGAPPNLRAREIDATARFNLIKQEYAGAIDALFGRLASDNSFELSADRDAMRDLIELAPPGLDELMAMVEVSDALGTAGAPAARPASANATAVRRSFSEGGVSANARALRDLARQVVILDTAPSGHALRLLEMPALVHDWVKALMGIVLKYQPVVGIGELGAVLLRMSQGLGRLRSLLADSRRSAFLVVTRPAALSVAETRRLLTQLRGLEIPVPVAIVNAWGLGTCAFCMTGRREQQAALRQIRTIAGRRPLMIAPATMPPPHGAKALLAWALRWRTND
jgi:arsenite-transporting ATPase